MGKLNDTGITTQAGTSGKEDADYGRDKTDNNPVDGAAGFSFTSLSSTCVRDDVTGLAWEIKTAANKDLTYTWSEAKTYAAGFSGCGTAYTCRLPSVSELLGIVYLGAAASPFIDATFFPNTSVATPYLSGTEVANSSPAMIWGVDFALGITDNAIEKTSGGYRARAVCSPK